MAIRAYRLTFVLRLAGLDADTTQQTVTIATEVADEALELAQFYRAGLPSGSVVSATLSDADGAVLWSEQGGSAPDPAPQEDQR